MATAELPTTYEYLRLRAAAQAPPAGEAPRARGCWVKLSWGWLNLDHASRATLSGDKAHLVLAGETVVTNGTGGPTLLVLEGEDLETVRRALLG